MLVLSRKIGEKVMIGDNISVTVVEVKGNRVRLAFQAPDRVAILRSELLSTAQADADADLAHKPREWHDPSCCLVME